MTSKEELEAAQKGDIRYSDRFWNGVNLEPFEMNVQSLDRTFIDKVFALCDYYMEND